MIKPAQHTAEADPPPEERPNLTQHVYERLIELLIQGTLRPGDIIIERKIAEQLNASRTPVREALSRLEAEGLVHKQISRGVTVSPFSAERFIEILSVRQLLEGEAARLAAGHIEESDFETIRRAQKFILSQDPPKLSEIWAADDILHSTIANASGNEFLAGLIRDLRRLTHVFNSYRHAGRRAVAADDTSALLNALERGDGAKAQKEMVKHIAVVKTELLGKLAGR